MNTADLIRSARHEAAISQGELARRAGIKQATLSNLENGRRLPSIPMLRTILAAAGKQVHAELEPLDDDIRRAISEIADKPPDERPVVSTWALLHRRDQVRTPSGGHRGSRATRRACPG